MLSIAAVVIVLSLTLEITASGGVGMLDGVPLVPAFTIPGLCLSKSMFGVACPGCGLTRSFVCLAHGRWQESLHFHRLGWLVALLVVIQFPYRALCLRYPNRRFLPRPIPDIIVWGLFLSLIVNWALGGVS